MIKMQSSIKKNDQKLSEPKEQKQFISKRLKKRLDKIKSDKSLTPEDKARLCAEIMTNNQEQSSLKRRKYDDLKDAKNFVAAEKPLNEEGGKSLWDDHEKAFLEEVTMNLIPDDEALDVRGKTVMKWDKVKKRYTLQRVDRDNKVIREKRNESGAKIDGKNDDRNNIYKKWQQKTHMSLQKTGERENTKLVAQARNSTDSRKMYKDFKNRHTDLNKGEDMRSNDKLFNNKGKKMQQKTMQARIEERKTNKNSKQSFAGSKR